MSYFVTLPSNGADLTSEYGKINNTQTDFEIDLKKPLDVSYKDYEVGLSQFSCDLSWLINIGKFKISHKTKKYDDIVENFFVYSNIFKKTCFTTHCRST